MKKQLFEHEVDFSKSGVNLNFKDIGDVTIQTRFYAGKIWAKFKRFTPESSFETTIDEDLTGVRLQYIMLDTLIRKTRSLNPLNKE